MELIQNNPYRIAGVLANATVREQQRETRKINAHASIGKEYKSEVDFPFLREISRVDQATITKAAANIQQGQDKVNNALFWFIKVGSIDATAIEHLKSGNVEKALEIWSRVIHNKEVDSRNFSAYNNLGTYKLLSRSKADIKRGIEAKIKLLESSYFKDFADAIAGQTYIVDNHKQIQQFIDTLLQQLGDRYSILETMELFEGCNGTTKKYLSKKFTDGPIHKVEALIESTKERRKQDHGSAYQFGLSLYNMSEKELTVLKSILGSQDLKYRMLADNVAKEIMQCGIDYFNDRKAVMNPSDKSLELLRCAQKIAVSAQTIDRIKDNIDGIEEWARMAPIEADLDFIIDKLKTFRIQVNSIANARSLVDLCKPKLQNIKGILGSNNELYLNVSTGVAHNAMGMLIEVVNSEQDSYDVRMGYLGNYKTVLRGALSISQEIDDMDMRSEQRNHFDTNYRTLKSIATRLGVSTLPGARPSPRKHRQPVYTPTPVDDPVIPGWVWLIGIFVFFIILVNACD